MENAAQQIIAKRNAEKTTFFRKKKKNFFIFLAKLHILLQFIAITIT